MAHLGLFDKDCVWLFYLGRAAHAVNLRWEVLRVFTGTSAGCMRALHLYAHVHRTGTLSVLRYLCQTELERSPNQQGDNKLPPDDGMSLIFSITGPGGLEMNVGC